MGVFRSDFGNHTGCCSDQHYYLMTKINTVQIGGMEVAQKYINLFYGAIILLFAIIGAVLSFDEWVMTKASAEEQHKGTAEDLLHMQELFAQEFKFDNFDDREGLLLARITNRELDLEFFFKIPEDQRTERDDLIIQRIIDQIDADTTELETLREDRNDYRIEILDPDGEL